MAIVTVVLVVVPSAGAVCVPAPANPEAVPPTEAVVCSDPTASISVTSLGFSNESTTFNVSGSDPDGGSVTLGVDGQATGPGSFSTVYGSPGSKTATLTVTDDEGQTTTDQVTFQVVNRRPTARFELSPDPFQTGQRVTFTSTSTDPDGAADLDAYEWDLGDGRGYRAGGPSVSRSFPLAGSYTIRLRVTDKTGGAGGRDEESKTVIPGDAQPSASLRFSPAAPGPGEVVTFSSTSVDFDGGVSRLEWDLDGDGEFELPTPPSGTPSRAFPAVRDYTVSVKAYDVGGQSDVATMTIPVRNRAPAASGVAGGVARLPLLRPFPVVRLRGTMTRTGARVRLLSVQAPRGARAVVRCKGRSCPKKRSQAAAVRSSRSVRFKRFHRHLRAGTVLEVFVTKPDTIGKYVRFTIRKRKPPARRDSCAVAGSRVASRCPTG